MLMRFRNASNEIIRKNCIHRRGSLPFSPAAVRINYQGLDGSLDGLCPCDYPIDVYAINNTTRALEKWALTSDGDQTLLWSSTDAVMASISGGSGVGWEDGRDFIYFASGVPNAGGAVVVQGFDGSDGSLAFDTTFNELTAEDGAGGFFSGYLLLSPRKGGGVYVGNADGPSLLKITNAGTITYTGAYTPSLLSATGGYRLNSWAHPDGFILRTASASNGFALIADDLTLISGAPAGASSTTPPLADQLGNIYIGTGSSSGVRKYNSAFVEVTTEQWPIGGTQARPTMCWVSTAGGTEELVSGVPPFVMLHNANGDQIFDGLFDNEGNRLWNWNSTNVDMPILGSTTGAGRATSYYDANPGAIDTDFAVVRGTVIFRYNHLGTEIASGTAPAGSTVIFAAGAESALR